MAARSARGGHGGGFRHHDHHLAPQAKVKDRRGVISRLWKYFKPYKWPLISVSLLVAVTTGLGLAIPFLTGRAIDKYISVHDLAGLARLLVGMVIISIISALGTYLQSVQMIQITQKAVRDVRIELFDHILTLPLSFFDKTPHGDVMSRMTNDTENISMTIANTLTQLVSSLLSVTGAGIIMFKMNWKLAFASIATLPFIMLLSRWLGAKSREGFRQRQEKLGALNGVVEETIQGQRVIKAYCREHETLEKLAKANVELKKTAILAAIYMGLMGPFMNMFRNMGFGITAGVGGWMVVKGMVTVGTVAAFLSYADFFNRPIIQIANLYGTLQSALAGAERVFAVMDQQPETDDDPDAIELTNVRGDVEFEKVSFGYEPDVKVLEDVSFYADAGQTIALVGHTGAGKTTIINLLTRFYDVSEGAIRIDEHDIRKLRRVSVRNALGIVLQDTYLFTDTVRQNIRYGRLEATDQEVEAAARLANADAFIRHLPADYDTVLTDAGSNLSQGQRQLLAIARALLADPAILILDEATSSVDTRTEVHIQQALHRLMQGRTSFIIAHRLSTVRQADCILVIEGGRIVERGKHDQLMAMNGAYHELYASQVNIPLR